MLGILAIRRYLRRQEDSPSPSRKIYHALVWVLAFVNVVRSVVDILQDNYPWSNMVIVVIEASSSSVILAVESSVVIFVLHAHMQVWSQLVKRVAIITGILFGLYSIAQVPLVYLNRTWITQWGYYSLYNYWIAVNSAWALVYLILITFKILQFEAIRMPSTSCRRVFLPSPSMHSIYSLSNHFHHPKTMIQNDPSSLSTWFSCFYSMPPSLLIWLASSTSVSSLSIASPLYSCSSTTY